MLCICQAGFEDLLQRELAQENIKVADHGPGWVRAIDPGSVPLPDLAFPQLILRSPVEIRGESVNSLASGVLEFFLQSLKGERVETSWPCHWDAPAETVGLGRRASSVEQAFAELLRKRLSRVSKLALQGIPRGPAPARGLFVWFSDFGTAWVSREAFANGQRRMSDDPLAPSRSFLKIEEAYSILGREVTAGETVVDLGAAPGGWSYSAALRGGRVLAIDNGPLKGGALGHPGIEHQRSDAFMFRPDDGVTYDWLFSDLLEEPHHVLRDIAEPWLAGRWCRRFVLNLKFGRVDPVALLGELRSNASPFFGRVENLRIRHLYHDREEFTLVGEVSGR